MSARIRGIRLLVAMGALLPGCSSCPDMYDQPKYETFEKSTFFEDNLSSRPVIPGTVARGHLRADDLLETGKVGGKESELMPYPVTAEMLERGRERYDIFCSPCHDRIGTGHGMVVRRGFRPPPSFHDPRLRASPVGHFFDVISHGFGAMYSYGPRVPVRDRWAIVAYVRALQLSQNVAVADLSPDEKKKLEEHR